MPQISGFGTHVTSRLELSPPFRTSELCAGATNGESRGAPVCAPALSEQHSTEKPMVCLAITVFAFFVIPVLFCPRSYFRAQAWWFAHVPLFVVRSFSHVGSPFRAPA